MMRRALLLVTVLAGCGDNTIAVSADAAHAMTLRAVEPARGPLPGGTTIVLYGAGFEPGAPPPDVVVGTALATQVGVVDEGTITATTPAGPVTMPPPIGLHADLGAGDATTALDVVIGYPDGFARLDRAFTYNAEPEIDSIDPAVGAATGGTHVVIRGAAFTANDAGPVTVQIGGVDVAATVVSDAEIDVVTPPAPPFATLDVTVANANGTATWSGFHEVTRGLVVGSNVDGAPYGYFWIDPATGIATRMFALAPSSQGMAALASDGHVVWSTSYGTPILSRFDPQALTTTDIGAITDPNGGGLGVAEDVYCADLELVAGALWCTSYERVYQVDPATAIASTSFAATTDYGSIAQVGVTTYLLPYECCEASFETIDPTGALGPPTSITLDGAPLDSFVITGATGFAGALYMIGYSTVEPDLPAGDFEDSVIYRVDVTSGAATVVTQLPFQSRTLTAIDPLGPGLQIDFVGLPALFQPAIPPR